MVISKSKTENTHFVNNQTQLSFALFFWRLKKVCMQYKHNLARDKRNTDIRRDLVIRMYVLRAVPQFCFSLQLRGFSPLRWGQTTRWDKCKRWLGALIDRCTSYEALMGEVINSIAVSRRSYTLPVLQNPRGKPPAWK